MIEECNFKGKHDAGKGICFLMPVHVNVGNICDGEMNCVLFQTYKSLKNIEKPK